MPTPTNPRPKAYPSWYAAALDMRSVADSGNILDISRRGSGETGGHLSNVYVWRSLFEKITRLIT